MSSGEPTMPRYRASVVIVLLLCAAPLSARSDADKAAIRAAALDYIEGWYAADAARMERALHPELAKRIVRRDGAGRSSLEEMTSTLLVRSTEAGAGQKAPESRRKKDVTILDVYENAASVRIDAANFVDYLHLTRWNGQWKILNVLTEMHPG
jgi:hypothetical protein